MLRKIVKSRSILKEDIAKVVKISIFFDNYLLLVKYTKCLVFCSNFKTIIISHRKPITSVENCEHFSLDFDKVNFAIIIIHTYTPNFKYFFILELKEKYNSNIVMNSFQTLNPTPKFFQHLRKVVGLSLVQQIVIEIALQHSENPEVQSLALEDLQKLIPDLIKNYVNSENSKKQNDGFKDSSPEILHFILFYIFQVPNRVELTSELKEKFLKTLRRDFPRELVPVVLAPLLYPGDGEKPQQTMASGQMVSFRFLC